MHDYDRTQMEYEFEDEYEADMMAGDEEAEFENEFEGGFDEGSSDVVPSGSGLVFDDEEEMELAAELLEMGDDEEMEQFLGRVLGRAARRIKRGVRRGIKKTRGVRRRLRRRLGKRIRSGLKKVARGVITRGAQAAGSAFGGPIGGLVGGGVGSGLASSLGLELEGLSPEDQDFEVARRVVRMAGDAVVEAANVPEDVDDEEAADIGLRTAIRRNASGMSRTKRPSASGRWKRKGNNIVLLNV